MTRVTFVFCLPNWLKAETMRQGNRPVSVAGDCCTATGVQQSLLWLDAHGDFNTWETTLSGFLGGMPLAMLVGRGDQTMMQGVGATPLSEHHIVLSDARNLDAEEAVLLAGTAVKHIPTVAKLLTYPLPEGPLYVHFDTDILDAADAPAMNYPEPNGPTMTTLHQLFQRLAESDRVVAVSVSAWNPALDNDGRTKTAVLSLLNTLLREDLVEE